MTAVRRVEVASRVGLHARPAAVFVRAAARQPVPVRIGLPGGQPVNATSILAVLGLGAKHGQVVELTADGDGAEVALDALEAVLLVDQDTVGGAENGAVLDAVEAVPRADEDTVGGAENGAAADALEAVPGVDQDAVGETENAAADPGSAVSFSDQVLHGMGIGSGRAVGAVVKWEPIVTGPPDAHPSNDPSIEAGMAIAAMAAIAHEMEDQAGRTSGPAAQILSAIALMAADPDLAEAITRRTREGLSAARAVWDSLAEYRSLLTGAGDYLAARAPDLDDLRDRTVARIQGRDIGRSLSDGVHPCVIVAVDLAPADTAGLDTTRVAAFVTEQGGPTSHTAIIARAAGIPAVVGCPGALSLPAERTVLVDAQAGLVDPHPDPKLVQAVLKANAGSAPSRRRVSNRPGATMDGHRVELLANINNIADAQAAQKVKVYREVFEAFSGSKVVIRVLDAGADKPLPFLGLGDEANPALGVRGLRALQANPALLHQQLDAIATAAHGSGAHVWVMAPMVADLPDTQWFCEQAQGLDIEEVGIMIEIPTAALEADHLLTVATFASIGTNDLTQYALAADRQAGTLGRYQDPWHPGVLRLVAAATAGAQANGRPIGVCGEAAGDPLLGCVLVGLGVSSLSMAASLLGEVDHALSGTDFERCQQMGVAALAATDARQARDAALALTRLDAR